MHIKNIHKTLTIKMLLTFIYFILLLAVSFRDKYCFILFLGSVYDDVCLVWLLTTAAFLLQDSLYTVVM